MAATAPIDRQYSLLLSLIGCLFAWPLVDVTLQRSAASGTQPRTGVHPQGALCGESWGAIVAAAIHWLFASSPPPRFFSVKSNFYINLTF